MAVDNVQEQGSFGLGMPGVHENVQTDDAILDTDSEGEEDDSAESNEGTDNDQDLDASEESDTEQEDSDGKDIEAAGDTSATDNLDDKTNEELQELVRQSLKSAEDSEAKRRSFQAEADKLKGGDNKILEELQAQMAEFVGNQRKQAATANAKALLHEGDPDDIVTVEESNAKITAAASSAVAVTESALDRYDRSQISEVVGMSGGAEFEKFAFENLKDKDPEYMAAKTVSAQVYRAGQVHEDAALKAQEVRLRAEFAAEKKADSKRRKNNSKLPQDKGSRGGGSDAKGGGLQPQNKNEKDMLNWGGGKIQRVK